MAHPVWIRSMGFISILCSRQTPTKRNAPEEKRISSDFLYNSTNSVCRLQAHYLPSQPQKHILPLKQSQLPVMWPNTGHERRLPYRQISDALALCRQNVNFKSIRNYLMLWAKCRFKSDFRKRGLLGIKLHLWITERLLHDHFRWKSLDRWLSCWTESHIWRCKNILGCTDIDVFPMLISYKSYLYNVHHYRQMVCPEHATFVPGLMWSCLKML